MRSLSLWALAPNTETMVGWIGHVVLDTMVECVEGEASTPEGRIAVYQSPFSGLIDPFASFSHVKV